MGVGMSPLDVLVALYLLVALLGMVRTAIEWHQSDRASFVGALGGCFLCLFWLPLLVALYGYKAWRRHIRHGKLRA